MSITLDRIRENGFIHCLLDDAADEIEIMENRIAQLEDALRFAYPVLIGWATNHASAVTEEAVARINKVLGDE